MKHYFGYVREQEDGEWVSVSDLMAVLMMIFMFIAVVYLRPLIKEKEQALSAKQELAQTESQVRDIVTAWEASEDQIYRALRDEFGRDLEAWGAELFRSNLMIRFRTPDVLFEQNSSELRPRFKVILSEFFPRYLRVLYKHKEAIEEVRIEGHTSSEWNSGSSRSEAFFKNMELSQDRTRSVLEYTLSLSEIEPFQDWAFRHVTANGLSSSRLLSREDGSELRDASRRVELSIRTNSTEQIRKVVETLR
tara:strand:+ start:12544 stop:13290 length:747 start_codon:yes stop_codon:yes gene_type:complete